MEDYEKSGTVFIAYKGREFSYEDIQRRLNSNCPYNYSVNHKEISNTGIIFAKIVYDSYMEDRDPFWNSNNKILTVSGYNQDEITNAVNDFRRYRLDDSDRYQRLINLLYRDHKYEVFKILSSYMHFCSVIWDANSEELIAGVTKPNNENTHLYIGYTKINHEVMYSNGRDILSYFCNEIEEVKNNTYIVNGEEFNIDGTKIKDDSFIPRTRQNADNLLDNLNALLFSITNEAVRDRISKNLEEYLASPDPQKKISDYLTKELNAETQKALLELIKHAIEEFNMEGNIDHLLRTIFDKILEDYTKTINVPVSHSIIINNTEVAHTTGGFYHEKYEQILRQTALDEPIMLIGPAGSGKNVAVSQVAESLGLHMYYTNNASNEFKLTGFIDAGGTYRETEFYKAFKNGGLFFLDEIDNSDPSALIVINSALANGYMAFPHETIDRHPDFHIIAAANTWGKGADLEYVGRTALDAATLDRFDNIFFDYDRKLEECLYPSEQVLKFMWSFRDAVLKSKLPHVVSTRGIGKVYKKELNKIPVPDILTSNVVKNLGQDDLNMIIGNMQNINLSNIYYQGLKSLKLSR